MSSSLMFDQMVPSELLISSFQQQPTLYLCLLLPFQVLCQFQRLSLRGMYHPLYPSNSSALFKSEIYFICLPPNWLGRYIGRLEQPFRGSGQQPIKIKEDKHCEVRVSCSVKRFKKIYNNLGKFLEAFLNLTWIQPEPFLNLSWTFPELSLNPLQTRLSSKYGRALLNSGSCTFGEGSKWPNRWKIKVRLHTQVRLWAAFLRIPSTRVEAKLTFNALCSLLFKLAQLLCWRLFCNE